MVEQLQHGSLDFPVSRFIVVESLGADSVDFINEDDCGGFLFGHGKGISHHFGSVTDVHLDQIWTCQFQECGFGLACTGSGHHGFACAWGSEHQASFGWSDSNIFKFVFMSYRQHNGLPKFFNLLVQSTNISVLFRGFFFQLHGLDSGIVLCG